MNSDPASEFESIVAPETSILDTPVNLFVAIFVPFVALIIALHCCLRRMKEKREKRRSDFLNCEYGVEERGERYGSRKEEDGECCDVDKQFYMVCTKRDDSIKLKLIRYTQTPTSFSEDEDEHKDVPPVDEVEICGSDVLNNISPTIETSGEINSTIETYQDIQTVLETSGYINSTTEISSDIN